MQLGLYQHYKGNFYHVIAIARHEETHEEMVIYRALYPDYQVWARPKAVFQSMIEQNGEEIARFKFVKTI